MARKLWIWLGALVDVPFLVESACRLQAHIEMRRLDAPGEGAVFHEMPGMPGLVAFAARGAYTGEHRLRCPIARPDRLLRR